MSTRDTFRKKLRAGELDDKEIEIEIAQPSSSMPMFELPNMPGSAIGAISIGDIFGKALGRARETAAHHASRTPMTPLIVEESDKLIDQDQIIQEAIREVENNGIVFLDEIDKICAREGRGGGDVSREGVQRDLLPLDRGHHGLDQAWRGEDRPYFVHRVGRVPRVEALRSLARTARAAADPGRAVAA